MEPWAEDLLKGIKNDSLILIAASEGMELIENRYLHSHGLHGRGSGADPHIWLDFQIDKLVIEKIVEVLSRLDPEGREIYKKNGILYKRELDELDRKYRKGLNNCDSVKIFLGGHSAFAYIAKRYGLEQIPLFGMSPDSEPKPGELAHMIDLAKRERVRAIFFERLVDDSPAKVIAEEIGAITLVLNPGPNITRGEQEAGVTFISIMEENLKNLREGLGCE